MRVGRRPHHRDTEGTEKPWEEILRTQMTRYFASSSNGDAGSPSPLNRLQFGLLAHP